MRRDDNGHGQGHSLKSNVASALGIAVIALIAAAGTALAQSPDVTLTEATTFQNSDGSAIPLEDRAVIQGSSSTLVRKNIKLEMTINTSELPAGVYTIWWHLDNNTGEPEDESILWATSTLVGEDGEASFSGVLKEGRNPGFVFTGDGLLDARGADVELFVRYHGPARFEDPEVLGLQLTDPFGGCTDDRNPLPTDMDFDCYNPQIAIHLAP